jgi:predicted MFS family arabinose efflux permease
MSNSRIIAWTIWGIASIFYAYQYILRVMPNIMLDEIMLQFNFTAVTFGQFSGIYYIGYSLMHLPIGIMLDRYGPRNVMTTCILMTVIGLLPIMFAEHWLYPIIGRALIGIGSSAAILGTFKIIRLTFKEAHFTRMLSFSVTIGLLGAIYGGAPVSYMSKMLGYQSVVQIFAIMGIGLAVLTYLIVPNINNTHQTSILIDLKHVFGNAKVIWLCILAGLMVGPLEGFSDVWGTAFFKHVYEFDNTLAASLPSLLFIGMCFGGPILSFISEKSKNYLGTITSAAFVMSLIFIILLLNIMTVSTISISLIIVGICCAYQILAIYKASTYVKEEVAGLTTAIANMIIMIFGYGFHSVIGLVIKLMGGTATKSAFIGGISVIPITLMISVIGLTILMYNDRSSITKKA